MAFFEWEYGTDSGADDGGLTINPDVYMAGDSISPPLVSMPTQNAQDGPFTGVKNLLGSFGSVAQTARDLGTAVGTVERDLKGARGEFSTARENARTGNKLAQWWDYAPMTDKVMVGIGVAGLALVIYQTFKGK